MYGIGISRAASVDIRRAVARVLRELGDPQPPLALDDVRRILDIDRTYYSSDDAQLFRQAFRKMTIAGKQVIDHPGQIKDVVRKRKLRAIWDPRGRHILIDAELPRPKQRWAEAHEIGHSLLDWHETFLHGDLKHTLSPACHIEIEAEANFAAGQLLFLGEQFAERWLDSDRSFREVQRLATVFGNSTTSTLWRAVECSPTESFGLVCRQPRSRASSSSHASSSHAIELIRSEAFQRRFGLRTAAQVEEAVAPICSMPPTGSGSMPPTGSVPPFRSRSVPPVSSHSVPSIGSGTELGNEDTATGQGELSLRDANDQVVRFHIEFVRDRFQTLVLGSIANAQPATTFDRSTTTN